MNTTRNLILSISAGLLIIAASCTSKNETSETTQQSEIKQSVPVKTMILKQTTIDRTIDYTASLSPFEEVHLAPSTPGRIEKINVEISDQVSKGQVIAIMDQTNLEQARINLMKLETDYKRLDTLMKTKSIAEQQYDQIKSAYELAKNSYQFLLENTKLKAPFSGVISGKYFEDGEIYSGAPNTAVGKAALVSIVQINQLKALIGISASFFPYISLGMKADIVSEIYPDQVFKGEIYRIYPTIDNNTKTFTVEVRVQNDNLKLRPGMFSKIKLNLGKGKAILVPTIALIKQTGTNDMYVFINKNNTAIKQAIKIGRIIDDNTEILDGLNEGDEIVVVGQNKLEHQNPITVLP
jgi:RND family efflux transporter MFP subunit